MSDISRSWSIGIADIVGGFKLYSLAGTLAWNDIKQRYRRSMIGPFWLTLGMGINIIAIGIVFSSVLKTPLHEFFPFVSLGLIFWGFISSLLVEGCLSFISADHIIKQAPLPLFVHVIRTYLRATIIFLHNLIIFPFVLIALGRSFSWLALLAVPGFFLLSINLLWMVLFLSVACTRYRDLPQLVASFVQVAFFFTPIIWLPGLLSARQAVLVDFNPMYHLMQIVRAPLLDTAPAPESWVVCLLLAVVGWAVTVTLFGKFQRRIAYWL